MSLLRKLSSVFTTVLALLPGISISSSINNDVLILDNNTVYLRDEVNNYTVSVVMYKMGQVLEKSNIVHLYITSPGGSVVAGNNLVTFIETQIKNGKKVVCIADIAASMAFVITQSCSERLVKPDSIMMQHQASFGLDGQTENNINMMNLFLDMLKYTDLKQAKRIGISLEEFKKRIAHDWWLYGEGAVKENVADRVVLPTCAPELITKTTTEKKCGLFFGCYKLTYSECPIIRGFINFDINEYNDKLINYIKATNPSSVEDIKIYINDFAKFAK